MSQVAAAERRYRTDVQVQVAADEWHLLKLNALGNSPDMSVDRITSDHGDWPPPKRTLLLERSSLHKVMPRFTQTEAMAHAH